MPQPKILIVDDDEKILFAFQEVLKKEGYASIEAKDGKEALEKFTSAQPSMLFMDITMPNLDGLEALQQIKARNHAIPVVIITGHGTMQTAIKAMQLGAFEYLTKPLSVLMIRAVMHRALASHQHPALAPEKGIRFNAGTMDRYEFVGDSAPMQEVYKLIGAISTTPNHTSVLIMGESGTGKELVARAIHNNSAHPQDPFVAVNCTSFPETLLESELFGHEKGAFTSATDRKLGKFEFARNGTIFLDEIGDLSLGLQQKLLRVLQEREFERLGGNALIHVGARFVFATNQDIAGKMKVGTFRGDLFFRLNVATIHLPPLREHGEDIPLLANYFLEKYNCHLKKSIKGFAEATMVLLRSYSYPGNVRELENLVERAVMLTPGEVILPDALCEMFAPASPQPASLPIVSSVFSQARDYLLNLFEKQFVTELLTRHHGNVSAAARASQMSRQNFHRLLLKHNLQADNLEDG